MIMEALMISGVAIGASLAQTLIQKRVMDVDLVKSLKADVKKLNKEMKNHRQDTKKTNELMKKSFEAQKKMMKHTMKPTIISSVVVLLTIITLGFFFGLPILTGEYNLYFTMPFSLPFIGTQMPWIGIFIVVITISSFIFRKVFDVGM